MDRVYAQAKLELIEEIRKEVRNHWRRKFMRNPIDVHQILNQKAKECRKALGRKR